MLAGLKKEKIMTSTKISVAIFLTLLSLLISANPGIAQEQRIVQATIPFEFWIEGSPVPPGDYRIEHVESTSYILFRSTDGNIIKEAYTVPLDETPVKEADAKLVFRVENGKRCLYEGWGPYGRRVVSAESPKPEPSGNERVEIPLIYKSK